MQTEFRVATAEDMEALGARLAAVLQPGLVIFLHGELGAGKTTLVRGLLRGLGFAGAVKSPTYTLVEPYASGRFTLYHFDLYRLNDPGELSLIGMRDYFSEQSICLIEWPERGAGVLPGADLVLRIEQAGGDARVVRVQPRSERGTVLLCRLSA